MTLTFSAYSISQTVKITVPYQNNCTVLMLCKGFGYYFGLDSRSFWNKWKCITHTHTYFGPGSVHSCINPFEFRKLSKSQKYKLLLLFNLISPGYFGFFLKVLLNGRLYQIFATFVLSLLNTNSQFCVNNCIHCS